VLVNAGLFCFELPIMHADRTGSKIYFYALFSTYETCIYFFVILILLMSAEQLKACKLDWVAGLGKSAFGSGHTQAGTTPVVP
jgi:hypothetical protein